MDSVRRGSDGGYGALQSKIDAVRNRPVPSTCKQKIYFLTPPLFSIAAVIATLAATITLPYRINRDVFFTFFLGFFAQYSFMLIAGPINQRLVNLEKHNLCKFAQEIYFLSVTLIQNIIENPTSQQQRIINATVNIFLGFLTAATIDTMIKRPLRDRPLANVSAQIEVAETTTLKTLPIIGHTAKQRSLVALAYLITSVAGVVIGHQYSAVFYRLSLICMGSSAGSLFQEALHQFHKSLMPKTPQDEDLLLENLGAHSTKGADRCAKLKKLLSTLTIILPGLLLAGANVSPIFDILAGLMLGIGATMHLIKYTENSVSDIKELERIPSRQLSKIDQALTNCFQKFLNKFKCGKFGPPKCNSFINLSIRALTAIGLTVLGGFIITQNSTIDSIAYSTFVVSLYFFFFLGMKLDSYPIVDAPNRTWINSAYFYILFYIPPPVIFLAVTQIGKIGSDSLDKESSTFKLIMAMFAYADLGRAAGSIFIQRIIARNLPMIAAAAATYIYFAVDTANQIGNQD